MVAVPELHLESRPHLGPRSLTRDPRAPVGGARKRICLVGGRPLLRASLRELLASMRDVVVVGESCGAIGAAEMATRQHPDVMILDLGAAHHDADSLDRLQRQQPGLGIVLTSVQIGATNLVRWTLAGPSRACLARIAGFGHLTEALRRIELGGAYLCTAFATLVRGHGLVPADTTARGRLASLSDRERDVLALAARGLTNETIACALGVRPSTARTHRRNLMAKLDLTSTVDLVRSAVAAGLGSAEGT